MPYTDFSEGDEDMRLDQVLGLITFGLLVAMFLVAVLARLVEGF